MKTPRDALIALGADLDRLSTTYLANAQSHALAALDGDENEARQAKAAEGKSIAFKHAMKLVDDLRQRIEAGEIG